MSRDLHNNINVDTLGVYPQAVGTTGSANGVSTAAIDRLGYDGVEFIFGYGTIPSTTETITPVVTESDASTGGFTSVADADLIGTEAAASFTYADDNKTKSIGYRGTKKYVRAKYTPANNTGNLFLAGIWRVRPRQQPGSAS